LSSRVELVGGSGRTLWPRPGRVFAAARSHTFLAIDTAFARWDGAHLRLFELSHLTDICGPIQWEDPPERALFADATRLSRLKAGEQFLYTFVGDNWTHLCTVAEQRIDPIDALGIIPAGPAGVLGLGRDPRPVRPAQRNRRRRNPLPPDPRLHRPSTTAPLLGEVMSARADRVLTMIEPHAQTMRTRGAAISAARAACRALWRVDRARHRPTAMSDEHTDEIAELLRCKTRGIEIVVRPTDAQLRDAAAALRHAARWLAVSPARTAAVTFCEYVEEYVGDPRWQRERALYVSTQAVRARADELGPARWRARALCALVEDLLRGDEIDQRLDAIERYQLL
jgi:hypothetical protein